MNRRLMALLSAVLIMGARTSVAADAPRTLAAFGFEEGVGAFADDESSGLSARLSPTAKWVRGAFGTALATGAKGACAIVDEIPGLDGASACTLAIRFRKTCSGSGDYPCVLGTTGWAPGNGHGGVIFFSQGKGLSVRLRSDDGRECAFSVLGEIPENRWISLVVVHARPDIRIYVDGALAASGKWDHPFALKGRLQLGGWNGNSFGGFVDDFRVWPVALDAAAVADYASASGYEEMEGYQDDGTGGVRKIEIIGQAGAPFSTLKGDESTLIFDTLGSVISLRENKSGRELLTERIPFVSVESREGRRLFPRRIEKRGENAFAWVFPGNSGEAVLSVEPFDVGWTFTVDSMTVKGWQRISLGCVAPVCSKWIGSFVNAWSDERSAVCVRSYGLVGEAHADGGSLRVDVNAPFAANGLSFGLAAGPRDGFRRQLQAMTIAAKAPRSDCGGAWSMGAEQSRRSYVFADVQNGDIDYWIDFVKRGGFSIIHISSSWADCFGPYTINRTCFPGGLDDMKAAAAKVHDAGLQVGIHTLTACINPHAKWIHPVCDSNLVADAIYTLAVPFGPDSREIVVEEHPIAKHSTVYSYSSNGNVMRLGGELIQYSAIRREKPYAFMGLKRGAFGTKRNNETFPAGTRIDYLHQRYGAFYPAPDSSLADRLADRLAEVYNTGNLDEFYFDGSEGMGTRYGIDMMRHKVYSRLKHNNGHAPSI